MTENLNKKQGDNSPFTQLSRIAEEIKMAATAFNNAAAKFNKLSHKLFVELARLGWYYNSASTIQDLSEIMKLLNKKDVNEINFQMSKILEKDYKFLKQETLSTFPEKSDILSRGFEAFEKGNYEYSILIFLTQTDSLCKKFTGTRLFGRTQGKAVTKKFADRYFDENSFISAALQPLGDYGEINKDEQSYVAGEFNRHRILHGEETNYGTKLNCYKMLSLVFYLTTIVKRVTIK